MSLGELGRTVLIGWVLLAIAAGFLGCRVRIVRGTAWLVLGVAVLWNALGIIYIVLHGVSLQAGAFQHVGTTASIAVACAWAAVTLSACGFAVWRSRCTVAGRVV